MNINLGFFSDQMWMYQIFAVVFATLFVDFLQKKLLSRLYRKLKRTQTIWDDVLIESIQSPLRVLIWLYGVLFAFQFAPEKKISSLTPLLEAVAEIGLVAIIVWFLSRFIKIGEKEYLKLVSGRLIQNEENENAQGKLDKTTIQAVTKLLRLSVVITGILIIIQTLGYSISGLLAFGGVGGIAVGFAAKDLLANFFGGIMIHLDRPFALGDWVSSPDRDIEGIVEHIGWRLTVIRSFDKRPIYIPNSLFTQIVVKNPSRMTNRRIFEYIGVRYDDVRKVPALVDSIKQMILDSDFIDKNATVIVNLDKLSDSSLDIMVYAYTLTTDWIEYHEIKHKVMISILNIIENHGAEAAFPTATLHISEKSDGRG
ncbi:mechanosensitive ion channel family protein [Pseudomonadota bacterium]|nr:mechanosensitive ion channel family protein [Pseudomonadota bacterium]